MMKNQITTVARFLLASVIMLSMVSSVSAKGKGDSAYQTGFIRWRAADNGFGGWSLDGVKLNANGALEIDPANAGAGSDPYAAGTYNGGNYYNGGTFVVGEATSPEITTPFNYTEAIASWNASTPTGSWVEIQFRAQYGTRWSKWYVLGIWASDDSTVRRHSVKTQGDTDGFVAVDTFVSSAKKATTNKFQLKLRLFSADGTAIPSVRNASLAYLDHYTGACEPRVRAAVEGVFDWIYDGHGNWPFNTAYAATFGYEGYVARFTSLEKAEEFVAAGVPVIMSIAWGKGELTGADIQSTNGHLLVLVGFDASGNPIVNDPASPTDDRVQKTYLRSEFEPLWLQASGGTVYLIYPAGKVVPPLQ